MANESVTEVVTSGSASYETPAKQRRRIVLSSYLGNTVEWYDFYIYGIAAALYFPSIFFASSSPLVGTIASFGTFASGFLARPIGGIIGGHFGDRYGRKSVLVVSMTLMGLSTFAVGALPGEARIGVAAPVILVLLRLVQGFAAGAEWGGGILMIVESCRQERRGFWGGIGSAGVFCGGVLATLTFTAISSLPDGMDEYIWRIPFLASAVLVLIGMWIRLGIVESSAFRESQDAGEEHVRTPFLYLLRNYKRQAFVAIALSAGANIAYQIYITYATAYTRAVEGDIATILGAQTLVGVLALGLTPFFGYLSDLVGRKTVTIAGFAFTVPWVYLLFGQLENGSFATILGLLILCEVGHSAVYGPLSSFLAELFHTRTRYTGVSLGYQIGGALAGMVPLVAATLVAAGGPAAGAQWVPTVALVASIVGIFAVLLVRETNKASLTGEAE
ncbi:major facilitator superfamily transporter [Rhodococcus opacus PD630]|uniref:MFS transporter n=1 Tax=Rhodococcus TaxID=1827 RepID=UPI00029CC237|nr:MULTISPECIES: MFS transporter [Rhodococcus]KXF57109.1 hypothetical protein AXA44_31315 [Rhodococcus sp. SC4]AHK34601.1 Shikimate transporter [Rhodococcus opacus PD630]EHI39512.1 major facilitator superfamily transporter [Rhodococcus opacus PD630]KXX56426.1 hypothetical protein AZG88_14520 [Rhodococcus sp. LB1]PBC56157.1 MFS transporter [Rhodococcus sp. ACPA1]